MSGEAPGKLPGNPPLRPDVRLLRRESCGLIALDKSAGVLSHPNSKADQDRALLDCRYDQEQQCYQWDSEGKVRRLWLLNRLDSATSGVILLADNEELALVIREHFRRKQVRKVYQALVFGTPSVPRQVWRDKLAVEKRAGQIRTSAVGNIPSECAMQLVAKRGGQQVVSLLRLEPRTGRSHQLRVQCATRGLPIVGDATYGDFGANRLFAKARGCKRLFLHSLETSFEFELRGRNVRFAVGAPLPQDFAEALEA